MSTLLSEEATEKLVSACRTGAGDSLRSVTYFTHGDFEQLYLRSDLERDADLSSFVGVERRESNITQNAYGGTELGEHEYTIRVFENGYLMRVTTERDGVFITTDGLTLRGFGELATAIGELLESFPGHD